MLTRVVDNLHDIIAASYVFFNILGTDNGDYIKHGMNCGMAAVGINPDKYTDKITHRIVLMFGFSLGVLLEHGRMFNKNDSHTKVLTNQLQGHKHDRGRTYCLGHKHGRSHTYCIDHGHKNCIGHTPGHNIKESNHYF